MTIEYYLQEIARRDAARQTKTILWLTVVIAILTAVNVGAVIVALASS